MANHMLLKLGKPTTEIGQTVLSNGKSWKTRVFLVKTFLKQEMNQSYFSNCANIFAQAGRTTFGTWRSAKTLVVPIISNRPGFLQRTSAPGCHTHSYVSCASPWHADFSYHDTSMATISGRECWPPEHFPERRSIRLPLCKLWRKFLHVIPVSFRSLFACRWRPTST